MKSYYLNKLNLLTNKTVLIPCIIVYFILILITVSNTYGSNLLIAVINQFNQTLEKDLLFIPIGIFLVCTLFDNRAIYKIRYTSLRVWLKRDMRFLVTILLFYTIIYVFLAVTTNIVATFVLATEKIRLDFSTLNSMILLSFRRYVFLLMLLNFIITGTLISEKSTHIVGFVCYVFFEVLQLFEMMSPITIIRPNIDLTISFLGNVFYAIPTIGLLLLTVAFNFKYINGDKS